jgi:hypothetical protein
MESEVLHASSELLAAQDAFTTSRQCRGIQQLMVLGTCTDQLRKIAQAWEVIMAHIQHTSDASFIAQPLT